MDDGNVCKDAEEHGAGAVHGITSAFFGDVNPTFRSLYEGLKFNYGQEQGSNIDWFAFFKLTNQNTNLVITLRILVL